MKPIRLVLSGTLLLALLGVTVGLTSTFSARPAAAAAPAPYACASKQLMMSYFRTWRDTASDPVVNKTTMGELPAQTDVAFVFPDGSESPAFWNALRDTYVPKLHAQGTRVVHSINVSMLLNPAYPNTAAGYSALAQNLIDTKITPYGLDGLDVDVERSLSGTDLQRATGVFNALGTKLGPTSGTGKLLIFDTNRDGNQALFTAVAPKIDYVLEQSYGRSVSGLQSTWSTFADNIQPCQYLIGFSFYEERGATWGDTTTPMTSSRAWAYANWQPTGATKGGIFSYAVDRDGVASGDDAIQPTTYEWTKALKNQMASYVRPNIALNRPATASSTENSSLSAANAVDGNSATRWSSANADPQWLRVDFGTAKSVKAVTIRWAAGYAKNYRIEMSNNGTSWTTISTRTSTGGTDTITGLNGNGRYLRVYMTARGTSQGNSIWELEAFNS